MRDFDPDTIDFATSFIAAAGVIGGFVILLLLMYPQS